MNGWDRKFIAMAGLVSSWSKDPSTKVGCVIADADHAQLSEGFNGFPRGIADDQRLAVREMKYRLIVHAEANAILQAARNGVRTDGCDIYTTASPCWPCFKLIANSGMKRIVFGEFYRDERIFEVAGKIGIELVSMEGKVAPALPERVK